MLIFLMILSSFADDSVLHGIHNAECVNDESTARTEITWRLESEKGLCEAHYIPTQVGGWNCKKSGCANEAVRCSTQFKCKQEVIVYRIEGKPSKPAPKPEPGTSPDRPMDTVVLKKKNLFDTLVERKTEPKPVKLVDPDFENKMKTLDALDE